MIREVRYAKSWSATDVVTGMSVENDEVYKNDRNTTRDPVPVLCRKLKAAGLAEDGDIVHVTRDGKPVFKRDLPLSWWTARDCVDSRTRGPRWVWHQELDTVSRDRLRARKRV